jgi:hypothetical protein
MLRLKLKYRVTIAMIKKLISTYEYIDDMVDNNEMGERSTIVVGPDDDRQALDIVGLDAEHNINVFLEELEVL